MNHSLIFKKALGAAVIVAMSSTANAELKLGADIEINTDMKDTATADTTFDQNGRLRITASSKKEKGDYFVSAQGQIKLNLDSDATTDNAYVQFGNSHWDLQVGRFEAIKLFVKGKDTLISHAGGVSVYEANLARGRVGDGGGQVALHVNADAVTFELGTIFGDPDAAGDNTNAFSGIRPAVTFAGENFKVIAGAEFVNYDIAGSNVDKNGYALTTAFNVGSAAINLNYAALDDKASDEKVTSMGANLTAGAFGIGVITSDVDKTASDEEVTTVYTAYTVPLLDIDGAAVTFALSSSTADGVADDQTTAARVRLNYTF